MSNRDKILAEREAKLNSALSAQASIVAYQETASPSIGSSGKAPVICFTLVINLPDEEPYQATTWWLVYSMAVPQLQVGKTIAVKVDAKDQTIIYPDMSSVEYDWRVAMGWRP